MILAWASPFQQSKKWPSKPIFFYFFHTLLRDFWFLPDFELINLCLMFFDKNDLFLIFKKKVTAKTQITAICMHVNYNIISNICLMEI